MSKSAKKRAYHVLIVRDDERSRWGIHFGDFIKEVVTQERTDLWENGDHLKKNMKVISSPSAQQADIDAIVEKLNEGLPPAGSLSFKQICEESGLTHHDCGRMDSREALVIAFNAIPAENKNARAVVYAILAQRGEFTDARDGFMTTQMDVYMFG